MAANKTRNKSARSTGKSRLTVARGIRKAARRAPKPASASSAGKARPMDVSSLPGPENILRRELSNGIVVLARENFTSLSAVFDADLRVGSLQEPPEKAGLAHLTGAALMRGSEDLSFEQIYEKVESVGASLSASGGVHLSGFGGKCLAEDLGMLLEIAAGVVRRPVFPPEQVERLRGEHLTWLSIRNDDTRARASEAFHQLAYAGHPYRVDDEGYPETIRAITRDEMADFHRRNFGPRGLIITVVGAVRAEEAVALVDKHFGDWSNPLQPAPVEVPAAPPPAESVTRRVAMPGKVQSDFMIGWPGPARKHPAFMAARLANSILGSFGMGGRIGQEVREKNGMAYYAGASMSGGLGPGPWYAYAGVNPQNLERALELTQREIRKFVARGVTAQELADNQAQFVGRLPLGLETNEGVADSIGSLELHGLGLDYLQRYPDRIRAVTRDDVVTVAREFLHPDRFALGIAGPE